MKRVHRTVGKWMVVGLVSLMGSEVAQGCDKMARGRAGKPMDAMAGKSMGANVGMNKAFGMGNFAGKQMQFGPMNGKQIPAGIPNGKFGGGKNPFGNVAAPKFGMPMDGKQMGAK